MPASADLNLLFGILALQMDFVTRSRLTGTIEPMRGGDCEGCPPGYGPGGS
jgi:hypothetical protein